MAAEIRVDTIKGRSGINTFSFKGDGFSFDQKVGIGTTVASDPVKDTNGGKLSVGVASCHTLFTEEVKSVGVTTFFATSGIDVATGDVEIGNGIIRVDGQLFIYKATPHVNIYAGNTSNGSSGNVALKIRSGGSFYDSLISNLTGTVVTGIVTASTANFTGTGAVGIPTGTTGERPDPSVAGDFRYNTTTGKFEGYTTEWGDIGGGAAEEDTAVSSTSATAVYTVAHASYRSASLIIQITQGSAYQTGRYLVIHDGTTATIVEEAAVATGSMLGTFTADISGSNLRVLVNMGSASSATVTVIPTPVTV